MRISARTSLPRRFMCSRDHAQGVRSLGLERPNPPGPAIAIILREPGAIDLTNLRLVSANVGRRCQEDESRKTGPLRTPGRAKL